jgi:glycosyltransferase involved in cell wall biosynthesis
MRVCVSVKGRFHAFSLAGELARRGCLHQLITSYPRFSAATWGIDPDRVSSIPLVELVSRAAHRLPARARSNLGVQFRLHEQFESRAAELLRPGGDVLVGWSGVSLAVLRRARELGMLTVLERGSTHIVHQREVLAREYERFGLPMREPHPRVVEKELAEYAEADRIVVPSRFVSKTFQDRGIPPEKLIQVPYGVDLRRFGESLHTETPFRILHCGSVSLRKGCHLLLEAFARLRLPQAELWFVGAVAPEMRPILRAHRSPAIHVLGSRPEAELPALYRKASLFCLASLEEGLALVLLQAMASGLPVLATPATGAEDLMQAGREGYLVPTGDVDALAERLEWLYRNPVERATMGREAARTARSAFTWKAYGERILDAYGRALEEVRPRAAMPGPGRLHSTKIVFSPRDFEVAG